MYIIDTRIQFPLDLNTIIWKYRLSRIKTQILGRDLFASYFQSHCIYQYLSLYCLNLYKLNFLCLSWYFRSFISSISLVKILWISLTLVMPCLPSGDQTKQLYSSLLLRKLLYSMIIGAFTLVSNVLNSIPMKLNNQLSFYLLYIRHFASYSFLLLVHCFFVWYSIFSP